MALLPLPHQSSLFSLQNKPKTHFPNISSACFLHPFSPLSTTLRFKATPFTSFVLHFSATTQHPALQVKEEEEEFSKTRLIAQNVPWSCTVEDIRSLFEKHGTVVDVELSMHNKTRNRGLAFVSMASPEEALVALNNLESYEFEGRTLRLNYAKPKQKKALPPEKPKQVPAFNLFVANLSYEVRAKHLKELFSSEGANVVSAEVIFHDNPRKSSGYGFVSFKSKKEADAALSAFQGKMFMGRPIRVQRSRQFVKVQSDDGSQSDDKSAESNPNSEQEAVD
ncbi:metallophosphoesterase 1-like [Hibiscus syriacus]|uniref:Metallophosphoesterase 1-like n=1 Tax=Hibiscus syriacus TaxID=106335 RepID=A0A6A2ZFR7_HIBSY|nr:28 kDa ribonucleoprotein, chloroplastic-like [Hibiscus syriacus]KAE8690400.1 metallophosphoesterase 1-like [Hibiscus syriacus]